MRGSLRLILTAIILACFLAVPAYSGQVTICQCNVFAGGRYTDQDQSAVTYDTAGKFAETVAAINPPGSTYPPVSVIGMQELISETDRVAIESLLEQKTGVQWSSIRVPQGIYNTGSGIGFFWRPDIIENQSYWNLGTKTVEILDNGYYVNFAGRLFRKAGTDEAFGLFTGKLTWGDAILNGHTITEEERRQESIKLLNWIRNGETGNPASPGMSAYPGTCRIITTDLNTDTGTSTWNQMNTEFTDPGDQNTHNSFSYPTNTLLDWFGKRLDYIWWDYDSYDKRSGGFVDGPRRTAHFGSDHRAVWATVNVQPSDITAPTISITSLANNQNIALDVKITANATDASGIGYVDFYIDNVKKWTDSTYPYEYDWSISSYSDGYHIIYASAVDNSANRMVGKSMQFRVNKITPTYCASVADAKSYPDQRVVAVYGRIVTAAYNNYFYIQDPDRNSGIKVYGNAAVSEGNVVDVAGTITMVNGERRINLISMTPSVR